MYNWNERYSNSHMFFSCIPDPNYCLTSLQFLNEVTFSPPITLDSLLPSSFPSFQHLLSVCEGWDPFNCVREVICYLRQWSATIRNPETLAVIEDGFPPSLLPINITSLSHCCHNQLQTRPCLPQNPRPYLKMICCHIQTLVVIHCHKQALRGRSLPQLIPQGWSIVINSAWEASCYLKITS